MLSRRQLRVRVMQGLYAWYQHEGKDVATAQRDLAKGNKRSYDLYLMLLLMLPELARIETVFRKDAAPKMASKNIVPKNSLSENIIIKWLEGNYEFNNLIKQEDISWQSDHELLSKMFNQVRIESKYIDYIAKDIHTPAAQLDFCNWLIDFVIKHDLFSTSIEEKNIFWAESLGMIGSMAIKTISQYNYSKPGENKIMDMYRDTEDDKNFMENLLSTVIKNDAWFTKLISEKTQNWEIERIAVMDVLLLKLALAEITGFENIPVKVTINEYLDISKIYSTPKSNVFINGVIDKLVFDLKRDGKVLKTGRGLVE